MSVAVVGSLGFDSVRTPFGAVERELGGAAAHAAMAASLFTEVELVAAVGDDFGRRQYEALERHGIETGEIVRVAGERSFAWSGGYDGELSLTDSVRETPTVLDSWRPWLGLAARSADILLLSAMDPEAQQRVREQWHGDGLVAVDSKTSWINTNRRAVIDLIRSADIVFLNGREARALTGKPLVLEAAYKVRAWGPKAVVLKLGEHGYAVLHEDGYFSVPCHPLEDVRDPTGTGSALAGGVLGYLDLVPENELSLELLRQAVSYGAAVASFCSEALGARRLTALTEFEVMRRAADFNPVTHLEHEPVA
jgi:sugar/nucleoside kinase (ribokinase family)